MRESHVQARFSVHIRPGIAESDMNSNSNGNSCNFFAICSIKSSVCSYESRGHNVSLLSMCRCSTFSIVSILSNNPTESGRIKGKQVVFLIFDILLFDQTLLGYY